MAASTNKLRTLFVVTLVVALGTGLVGYYWAYLKRDELRDWNERIVEFVDVGGLKKKDPVLLHGARIGRVKKIYLHEDRQRAVLQYEGELALFEEGLEIEIVSRNALGQVAIEIHPGDVNSRRLGEDEVPLGALREGLGIGGDASKPGRQKQIKKQLQELALETKRALSPDGNVMGELLFSKARYLDTQAGLKGLAKTWEEIDQGLADFERRQTREGMLSRQSYLIAADTLASFESTMRQLRTGFRKIERREGAAGRLLADPGARQGARALIQGQSETWKRARRHEGTLGKLVDPGNKALEPIQKTVDDLEDVTEDGDQGKGFMGTLSHPAVGESVRGSMRGIEATFRRLRESQSGISAREDVEDSLGNLDDFLIKAKRGLAGLRASFPDKTFHGAVFSVF
jgi:MlaD protein